MPVTVNLASEGEGVIKNFLDSFFEKDTKTDNEVIEWINIFDRPLEAIDLMASVVDNSDYYNIQLFISMDSGLVVEVDQNNINDIIKFMLFRYYKDNS